MTQPFQYAGSISHGTLREEDLVPTFLSTLGDLDIERASALKEQYADAIEHLEQGLEPSPDDLDWLMEALFDALNAVAPAGYTFVANEGDGTDFGFWQVEPDEPEVNVVITRSTGADGAILVMIDTNFAPDASDGSPGLRVLVNDSDALNANGRDSSGGQCTKGGVDFQVHDGADTPAGESTLTATLSDINYD